MVGSSGFITCRNTWGKQAPVLIVMLNSLCTISCPSSKITVLLKVHSTQTLLRPRQQEEAHHFCTNIINIWSNSHESACVFLNHGDQQILRGRIHICTVSRQCEYACAFWNNSDEQIPHGTHCTCTVFRQCEYACVFWDYTHEQIRRHIRHICMVSPYCEYACVFQGYLAVKIPHGKHYI